MRVAGLTAAYPGRDAAIPVPGEPELRDIEKQIAVSIGEADAELAATTPRAVPSAENCGNCQVRHLCDAYWSTVAPDPSDLPDEARWRCCCGGCGHGSASSLTGCRLSPPVPASPAPSTPACSPRSCPGRTWRTSGPCVVGSTSGPRRARGVSPTPKRSRPCRWEGFTRARTMRRAGRAGSAAAGHRSAGGCPAGPGRPGGYPQAVLFRPGPVVDERDRADQPLAVPRLGHGRVQR